LLLSEKGYTNKNLAEYLGIPSTVISDWKRGSTSYLKYVAELSDYFDVSADYILGRTPIRVGSKWDELVKQYQLCEDNKQSLINRLLGITQTDPDSEMYYQRVEVEEDMSMLLELVSMFDQLTLIGKSRLIAIAADELDKIKTTSR
jgi:transcriptional regulator with XRE-family HTH domain